tara:strand:+ start:3971 stop:4408 length:438 start_codon:yes stop_codon:yes gene_type:complete
MSDTENITIEVKDPEDIFIKEEPKKKKRVLTQAQKDALAKGRAKVKENKAKKKSTAELKKEQRETKKELTKTQKRQAEARKKMKDNEKLEQWEDKKYEALGNLSCSMAYKTMESYLNTLTREQILDDDKLKDRLQFMVKHLELRK